MRAFDAVLGTAWAMLPEALETMLSIALRENDITPEALEAYRAQSVGRAETLEQRDGVAVLNAIGPLFRRANLFTAMSGATSYEIMRRDLQVALDDPALRAVLLNLDTPGGDANGIDELAKAVSAGRSVKPIVAYVGGQAASAGYWLASAASEIVVSDTATLGSIGVVLSVTKREASSGAKSFEFVSSQSPLKRVDPETESGASELQRLANDLGQVFVESVATNRGRTVEQVMADFGKGGMLVGAKAVAAGLADRLGTFEGTLAQLQNSGRSPGRFTRSARGTKMSEDTQPGAKEFSALEESNKALSAQVTELTKSLADRDRRDAILALDEAQGREAQAKELAASGVSVDAAKKILAAGPKASAGADDEEGADLPNAQAYAAQRGAGAGAAAPGGKPPTTKGDRSVLAAAVTSFNKRR
ncbi:S49 family peptidase [Ancylobacter sp. SL191]|uniref:S49 family peptidase n=1 Tax=Ancylobacter sp. SL191 TaxID=2995166 RepID=UPI00226FED5B|nr:S49 family peptidase [Ancylobacter sp. SL191]WAC26416.1 S49 family peptidase [Ancylobacter sp. SL191]